MKVVLGEVERLLRLAEKGRDLAGDVARLLPTVRQRPDIESLGAQRTLTGNGKPASEGLSLRM
jgi:hypothetical protein